MNETENSQHVEQLKRMIAENDQMRKELKSVIEQIEDRLQQKNDPAAENADGSKQ